MIESGGRIEQETRLWNVAAGRTEPMRSKEFAHDYRYFPEPDLLPVRVTPAWKGEILREMPELPDARRERFRRDFGITSYDAGVLTATRDLADYFEAVVRAGAPAKAASNWIQTEVLRRVKDIENELGKAPPPSELAKLIKLVDEGQLTANSGKKLLEKVFEMMMAGLGVGLDVITLADASGLRQIKDTNEIERLCREVIEKNPDNVAKYRAGNEGVFKFFVGQVMRASRGQANPQTVNGTLKRLLS